MIPYQLVLDLLRSSCGIVDTDAPEAIADKVRSGLRRAGMDPDQDAPLLLYLLGLNAIDDPVLASSPEVIKDKIFDIFRSLAINGSRRRALVLVVEDLHWIDKISAEFLRVTIESLTSARILLIATYRPGFVPSWRGLQVARQVALQPLAIEHSRQFARSGLAGLLLNQVAEDIVAKADGNPLFLEQLVLHTSEATTDRELIVPATINDVIMARIDRLSANAKHLLQTAAVIGREFSLHLLNAVWDRPVPIDAALGELCRLEFLDERIDAEGVTYGFHHALAREAAYGSLLARQRRVAHARIGAALEKLYQGRTDEVAELLALHFDRSDEVEKAVDSAIAAAKKAQRRCAYSEALSYFRSALRQLDAMTDTNANRLRRLDAVIEQGEVRLALGQHAEHIAALNEIRDIVDTANDPRRRVAWHYWTGFLHGLTGGRPDIAIQHCRDAAAIASAAAFSELDGYVASCLAQACIVAGKLEEAVDAARRALSVFEARGDLWPACRALWHVSSAANYLGQWEESFACCQRALDLANAIDDFRLKTQGLWRAAHARVQRGDLEEGLRYCDEVLSSRPIPYDSAAARAVRGYGLIRAGRAELGISELEAVLTWFENSRLAYFRSIATLWLAEGYLVRGDIATARPVLERVVRTCQEIGYLHFESLAHRLLADCLIAEDLTAAADHLAIGRRMFEQIGARNEVAKALVSQAALRQRAGDVAAARQLLDEAHAIFVALGTRIEPERVKAAILAADCGAPILPLISPA